MKRRATMAAGSPKAKPKPIPTQNRHRSNTSALSRTVGLPLVGRPSRRTRPARFSRILRSVWLSYFSGMNHTKERPRLRRHIVDHHIWLRKKADETRRNTQLLRRCFRVRAAAATPAIEFPTVVLQSSDVTHDVNHRNSLRASGTDQGVIDIDVGDFGHVCSRLPCDSPVAQLCCFVERHERRKLERFDFHKIAAWPIEDLPRKSRHATRYPKPTPAHRSSAASSLNVTNPNPCRRSSARIAGNCSRVSVRHS
jgi:hypothetical protein